MVGRTILHGRRKKELSDLIETNPTEVENSFYTSLTFGTAGVRGLMGLGPNRMNIHTIRKTTQGIVNYLLSYRPKEAMAVVIGYDSRFHSREFACETARVFAAASFSVYLFRELSPTPLVSFACRHLKATVAVMITASHNPPEYNGYKVYWSYGGQVLPPHDEGMIREVARVQGTVSVAPQDDPHIHLIGRDIDDQYLFAIRNDRLWHEKGESALRVIYSPLHGTGGRLMGRALQEFGITALSYVKGQMAPDGAFPTVHKPNPEDARALQLGIEQMVEEAGDIFLASDPDADRLGCVVMHEGKPEILTGNQIAAIMCEWILRRHYETKRLSGRYGVIKSCVTTPLIDAIARRWNALVVDVLPGFKYIAEEIERWDALEEPIAFIFGAEESYGTLYGLHARDKDAISSGAILSEIAWHMKTMGKTLLDALYEIYRQYGYFFEDLLSIEYDESKEGRLKMNAMVETLRHHPPDMIDGRKVIAIEDLATGRRSGDTRCFFASSFPKADVLIYTLEDRTKIMIRPSGTEPKVKVYLFSYSKQYDALSCTQVQENSRRLKEYFVSKF